MGVVWKGRLWGGRCRGVAGSGGRSVDPLMYVEWLTYTRTDVRWEQTAEGTDCSITSTLLAGCRFINGRRPARSE